VGLSTIGLRSATWWRCNPRHAAEFYFADLGVMAAGSHRCRAVYQPSLCEQAHALRFCEARVAMVENPKAMLGLQAALPQDAPDLQWILLTGTGRWRHYA